MVKSKIIKNYKLTRTIVNSKKVDLNDKIDLRKNHNLNIDKSEEIAQTVPSVKDEKNKCENEFNIQKNMDIEEEEIKSKNKENIFETNNENNLQLGYSIHEYFNFKSTIIELNEELKLIQSTMDSLETIFRSENTQATCMNAEMLLLELEGESFNEKLKLINQKLDKILL